MKFGLFFEMQVPLPWGRKEEQQVLREALEQVEAADQAGFDYVWEVEHHFLREYSHSSAPEVFLAAASQRTKSIRLGHGVTLLPKPFNHVARVAERTATLDILSGGRLDVGTGRSGTSMELDGFEVDTGQSKAMWEEAVRLLPRLWTEDEVSFDGQFYNIPRRTAVPKPMQQPHPPMWVAGGSDSTIRDAGLKGFGALGFAIGYPEVFERRLGIYRQACAEMTEPASQVVNHQFAGFTPTLCLEDDAEARRIGGRNALWYVLAISGLTFDWIGKRIPGYEYYGDAQRGLAGPAGGADLDEMINRGALCIGDPESCLNYVKMYEAAGMDQMMFMMQTGATPHDKIMESIRLFGEYIIPKFKKTAGNSQRTQTQPAGVTTS